MLRTAMQDSRLASPHIGSTDSGAQLRRVCHDWCASYRPDSVSFARQQQPAQRSSRDGSRHGPRLCHVAHIPRCHVSRPPAVSQAGSLVSPPRVPVARTVCCRSLSPFSRDKGRLAFACPCAHSLARAPLPHFVAVLTLLFLLNIRSFISTLVLPTLSIPLPPDLSLFLSLSSSFLFLTGSSRVRRTSGQDLGDGVWSVLAALLPRIAALQVTVPSRPQAGLAGPQSSSIAWRTDRCGGGGP